MAQMNTDFFWTRIARITNVFGTRMDTDFFFEHESLEWKANIFGTRMDEHGFTMRMITLFILPQMAQMNTDLESLKWL